MNQLLNFVNVYADAFHADFNILFSLALGAGIPSLFRGVDQSVGAVVSRVKTLTKRRNGNGNGKASQKTA